MASLRQEFDVAVRASSSAIRIDTDEQEDAIQTIAAVCRARGWNLRIWDAATGLTTRHPVPCHEKTACNQALTGGPAAIAGKILEEAPMLGETPDAHDVVSIVVLRNFHLCLGNERHQVASYIQHIIRDKIAETKAYLNNPEFRKLCEDRNIDTAKDTGKFIVALMPQEQLLPPELRPLFQLITHELPDADEMLVILDGILPETSKFSTKTRRDAAKQALGLTRLQAESVFAQTHIRLEKDPELADKFPRAVGDEKAKILNAEGLVEIYQGKETFDDIVGHNGLKTLLVELLTPDKTDPDNPELRSKGVALVGPPRTGKSLTAKAVGNMTGRVAALVNVGNLMGGLVGDTEKNTRKFFQTIKALAPVIAIIDEVEKVMPSAKGHDGDSGVGRRMAGTFMTQMQDIKEDVFWCVDGATILQLEDGTLEEISNLAGQPVRCLTSPVRSDSQETAGIVYDVGEKPTLRIATQSGELTCTADHVLFCLGDEAITERRADAVVRGDYIVGVKSLPHAPLGLRETLIPVGPGDSREEDIKLPLTISEDLAYFVGYMCGDGGVNSGPENLRAGSRLQWSEEHKNLAERLADLTKKLFGKRATVRPQPTDRKGYQSYIDSTKLCRWLVANFPEAVAGKIYADAVPSVIHRGDEAIVANFLAGLFDAEGSVLTRNDALTINMVSERCVRQAMLLFARFGILSSYARIPKELPRHDVHRLTIADTPSRMAFIAKIPVRHSAKRKKLARLRAYDDCKGVRNVPAMRCAIAKLLKANGMFGTILPGFRNPGKMISETTATTWLSLLTAALPATPGNTATIEALDSLWRQRWVRVKSVSPAGVRHVYDFSTKEPHHSFLANGLLVHNCFTANSVDTLHEAFLADDRVDCVVYVGQPDAAQRAAGWKFYLKKFFPEKFSAEVMAAFTESDDVEILVAGLLQSIPKNRPAREAKIFVSKHGNAVKEMLFSDEGWTLARIKACCRMARKRNRPLSEIAATLPREQHQLQAAIAVLEEWAEQEAIDANTGLAYVRKSAEQGVRVAHDERRRKRKVREGNEEFA